MSSPTPELERSPLAKVVVPKINESLLTNAFDDCLKLVEKSVNNNSNANNNKGSTTKTRTKETPKFVKKEPEYHKHELTNKSRKFRYSADEAKGVGGNAPIIMPPPLDPGSLPLSENEDEARASMLMSWYMAGYHTGYFEAMKKFKK